MAAHSGIDIGIAASNHILGWSDKSTASWDIGMTQSNIYIAHSILFLRHYEIFVCPSQITAHASEYTRILILRHDMIYLKYYIVIILNLLSINVIIIYTYQNYYKN